MGYMAGMSPGKLTSAATSSTTGDARELAASERYPSHRRGQLQQVLDALIDDRGRFRVGARPQMQHVVEVLAKVGGRRGVERGCEIHEAHSASLRHRAHDRVAFGDMRQHVALRLHRIGKIAGKGEDGVAAAW